MAPNGPTRVPRPAHAPQDGAGGGRSGAAKRPAPQPKKSGFVGKAAKFAFSPEIGRSLESVKFAWTLLVNLIAQIFIVTRLIPADHPCGDMRNADQYSLRSIIGIAYGNLKWEKSEIPQIVIFFAVVAFLFFIALSMITLLMNVGVNVAHAQPVSGGGNAANDVLNNIFNLGGSGMIPTALGGMLKAYSSIVLILAGLILVWIVLTAVVESMREGKPLGKGFNGTWAPMRLVFALGLLIPLSSGLNSGQYITLYLAKWGSELASGVYKQFSNQIALGQGVTVSSQGANTQRVIAQVFDLYVNAYVENDKNPGAINIPSSPTPVAGKSNYYELAFTANPSVAGNNRAGTGSIYFNLNPSAQTKAEQILTAQATFFRDNSATISAIARDVADRFNPAEGNPSYFKAINSSAFKVAMEGIARQYSQAIGEEYKNAVADSNDELGQMMEQSASSLGWISAPVWHMKLAQRNADLISAANSLPQVIVNGNNMSDQLLGNSLDTANAEELRQGGLNAFTSQLQNMFFNAPIFQIMSTNGGARLYKEFIIDSSNPFGSMVMLGQLTLHTAQGLTVAWPAFAFWVGITSSSVVGNKFEGVAKAMDAITPLIATLIGLLFANGYMLGIMFPLIPVIRFIFAVTGWISIVLIAIMGMPLFALAHLKTGGEGWVGQLQVASTYNMLMGIIIRPTLIMIGFIVGMIFFNYAIKVAGSLLMSTMDANNTVNIISGGLYSNLNIVTQVLTLFLFSSFAVGMANACFKLVDIIPSQAMTWMGTGPMSSPTEDATDKVMSETQSFAGQFGQFNTQSMQYRQKVASAGAGEARRQGQVTQKSGPDTADDGGSGPSSSGGNGAQVTNGDAGRDGAQVTNGDGNGNGTQPRSSLSPTSDQRNASQFPGDTGAKTDPTPPAPASQGCGAGTQSDGTYKTSGGIHLPASAADAGKRLDAQREAAPPTNKGEAKGNGDQQQQSGGERTPTPSSSDSKGSTPASPTGTAGSKAPATNSAFSNMLSQGGPSGMIKDKEGKDTGVGKMGRLLGTLMMMSPIGAFMAHAMMSRQGAEEVTKSLEGSDYGDSADRTNPDDPRGKQDAFHPNHANNKKS